VQLLANSAARLLTLGLLTLLLNKQAWSGLFLFIVPLLYLFYKYPKSGMKVVLLARRLRWFYLSIIILYFWFYPGTELIPWMGKYSPALEGMNEAGLRIASLLIIISYSVFFISLTPRGEIIAAIQFLLSPLTYLSINSDRFALRLGLVLSMVTEMTEQQKRAVNKEKADSLTEILDRAAVMVNQADNPEFDNSVTDVLVTGMQRPGLLDILIPLLLFIWLLALSL
jgi:energy-coupling factor transporter transmembrane protein EcfT